jgi:chromosomal replication initiator protein
LAAAFLAFEERRIDEQLTLIWNEAKAQLRGKVNEPTFRLWFERTLPLDLADNTFVLAVPTQFARDWVEGRFAPLVREALAHVLSAEVELRVVVDAQAAEMAETSAASVAPRSTPDPVGEPEPGGNHRPAATRTDLNPRYVFERFVVGPHNEYATAVARSVAESPATAYNPVFVYGGTGLGKTHLVQAIGHEVAARHPELKVKYVTCEQFTDDFISGVTEKGRVEGFKRKYRTNDLLIVDDVQFLAGKEGTQIEFFQTFNSLYEADKQIVITSDRPPRELEELEERLRTRFGQGVVVDIARPDLETRIAILRKQVKWEGFRIAEPEVLEFIASRITANIRELYGALTRVVSFASIRGADVDLAITKEALQDILPKAYAHLVTVEMVQAEVARQFGVHVNDLRSNRRTQDISYARQVAMYLARELTEASLPYIGDRFGGRDHTTVLYAVNKIKRQLTDDHDRQLHEIVQVISSRLKAAR